MKISVFMKEDIPLVKNRSILLPVALLEISNFINLLYHKSVFGFIMCPGISLSFTGQIVLLEISRMYC